MNRHPVFWIVGWATIVCSSGATCIRSLQPTHPSAPAAFVAPPTLDEAIYSLNANAERVRSLQSDNVSVSTRGFPALRANLALESPRRFRLRGSLLGPELDVGSNDELFWMWVKSNPEPAVYYARHEQLRGPSPRLPFLVRPECLIEAFGLVHLSPAGIHEGPFPRGNGCSEIRSRAGELGQYVRTIALDETYGWVLEQTLTDDLGQTLVSARMSGHRYYPAEQVSLPHHVELQFPLAQFSCALDVGQFSINQIRGALDPLWSPPQMEGYSWVNLAEISPTNQPLPFPTGAGQPSPGYADRPLTTSYRPRYRGYQGRR